MRHLWPSSLLKRFWHAGKEDQCPIVQGSEVMVKLFAQHTSLVTWLTPTHLQFQFITITTMNPPPKKIPARHHLMLLCLWPSSPSLSFSFFLPFSHGALWSVSLSRISSPLRSLLSWFLEPTAVICPHFSSMRLEAESWGEHLPAPAMGEGAQKGFLFSCQWHKVPARGKRGSKEWDNLLKFGLCSLVHHSYAGKLKWHLQLQPDKNLNLWISSLLVHYLRQLTQQGTTGLGRN